MVERLIRRFAAVSVILVLIGVGWAVGARLLADLGSEGAGRGGRDGERPPVAVAVAPTTVGDIAERLVVSGSLVPAAEFVIAPEVDGRLVELLVAQAHQRDLLTAQLAELEAAVDYRAALTGLYRAEGSLLERRGIALGTQ